MAAFTAGPAGATNIVLDGSVADWQAAGLYQNSNIVNGCPAMSITAYGATIQNNTFYAFVQTNNPLSAAIGSGASVDQTTGLVTNGTGGAIWPGWYINVDNNTTTQLLNTPGVFPAQNGIDIEPEWDISTVDYAPYGLNIWGAGGDLNNDLRGGGNKLGRGLRAPSTRR